MQPLRFEPFLRPMVWGGRRLGELLHKNLPDEGRFGESWDVSDHSLHNSLVAEGPHRGKTLRQFMERHRDELLGSAGTAHETFPWLIKFLDANDRLSVQVHPDKESVKKLWPGENSKTEAWFIMHADPGSKIYAGLRDGVDEAVLRAALQQGNVAECLHQFEPKPGDCVHLPAGTVHALGGGIVLAEIQQTSDATFRLFDWNRLDAQGNSRTLHVEEAISCIHWGKAPVHPVRLPDFSKCQHKPFPLMKCPYFEMQYWLCAGDLSLPVERLSALIVVNGRGSMRTKTDEFELQMGQVWVLPAACPEVTCQSAEPLGLVICRLP